MKFFTNKNKLNHGFTLLETLVAISIFSLSILAVMSVLSRGISSTNYAKKRIISSYLAEEGVEYVRNIRDTLVGSNADSSAGWTAFTTNASACISGCYVQDFETLTACSGSCTPLLYDQATGIYGYTTGVDSGYTRTITVETISVDELKVTSSVSWMQGSGSYNITFTGNLFNWIE
jgi:prepilin-type N-terminal cleavage/methylation domain-containing protein